MDHFINMSHRNFFKKHLKRIFICGVIVVAAVGGIFAVKTIRNVTILQTTAAGTTDMGNAEANQWDRSYTRVINRSYPIAEDFISGTGELIEIEGLQMEKNAGIALEAMVADLKAEGMDITLISGYRSDEKQEELYRNQILRQNGNQYKAATISALPLSSEHQAGLAIDLSVDGTLDQSFADTAQGRWLKEHCAEYGYILRYPAGKELVTGIISEPWHFRYVGSVEEAQSIMSSGLCMEEYYDKPLLQEDLEPYRAYLIP